MQRILVAQKPVEYNQVEPGLEQQPLHLLGAVRAVDAETLLLERFLEEFAHSRFVFDNEDAGTLDHVSIVEIAPAMRKSGLVSTLKQESRRFSLLGDDLESFFKLPFRPSPNGEANVTKSKLVLAALATIVGAIASEARAQDPVHFMAPGGASQTVPGELKSTLGHAPRVRGFATPVGIGRFGTEPNIADQIVIGQSKPTIEHGPDSDLCEKLPDCDPLPYDHGTHVIDTGGLSEIFGSDAEGSLDEYCGRFPNSGLCCAMEWTLGCSFIRIDVLYVLLPLSEPYVERERFEPDFYRCRFPTEEYELLLRKIHEADDAMARLGIEEYCLGPFSKPEYYAGAAWSAMDGPYVECRFSSERFQRIKERPDVETLRRQCAVSSLDVAWIWHPTEHRWEWFAPKRGSILSGEVQRNAVRDRIEKARRSLEPPADDPGKS